MTLTRDPERPTVSVVMATYNRSNLLPYVIETVRRQTLTDWELLVIGDRCTDDTAAVVEAIRDPRITFSNLETPKGEQSGPNNAGCARARGQYIAMLNHDDFWLPRHLARGVAELDRDRTIGLVYGLNVAIQASGEAILWGPTPPDASLPDPGIPASGWVFRRELFERVGPWRGANEIYQVPSQDWLRRAVRLTAVRYLPHFSVLSLPSAGRARSYADRVSAEHAEWFRRMTTDPFWAEDLLARVLSTRELSSSVSGNSTGVTPFLGRAIKNAAKRGLRTFGISPVGLAMWARYGRRGGFVAHARRVRGI